MLLDRKGDILKAQIHDGAPSLTLIAWEEVGNHDPALGDNSAWGLDLPNTVSIDDVAVWLPHLSLVSIRFPSFSDGRGYSLARKIRQRGYQGILRARGPLIPDQFYYLTQCGFDEVELPDTSAQRQTSAQWQQALAVRKGGYQEGYHEGSSILQARRQARAT